MTAKLGQILLRAGAVSGEQLAAGLRQQVVYGGRLGTNLIELGYATADQVAHGLAVQHRVAAALLKHIQQHDPAALDALPRELCARYCVFPIAFALADQRKLVVCFRDPNDDAARAHIGKAAAMPIVSCVAPELLIYLSLERFVGLDRPPRFVRATPGGGSPLPHTTGEVAAIATEDDIDIDIDMDEETLPAQAMTLVELDDIGALRDEAQFDFEAHKNGPSLSELANRLAVERNKPDSVVPACNIGPTLPLDDALAAMTEATHRAQVSDAVVAWMRSHFDGGLILIARNGVALGYKGFGGNFDDESVESVLVPLGVESPFETAAKTVTVHRGPADGDERSVAGRFLKLFPLQAPPADFVVAPVAVKNRVVCLIYGHPQRGGRLGIDAMAELEQVSEACGQAFVRLIKAQRAGGAGAT